MDAEPQSLAFQSRSEEETEALGERLGRALAPETGAIVIALDGELGAGKTCFVRGLARGLGITEAVSSPTYALLQTYEGARVLHHLDAWMEGRERGFLLDGGLDWVTSRGITVVEWAERVADVLPETRISVHIARSRGDERVIRVSQVGGEPAGGPLARVLSVLDIA